MGTIVGVTIVMCIQDTIEWGLVFCILVVTMVVALFFFLCGTIFYQNKLFGGGPLTQIIHVFVAMFHKWWNASNKVVVIEEREVMKYESRRQYMSTNQFR